MRIVSRCSSPWRWSPRGDCWSFPSRWTASPSCRTPTDELSRLHAGHPRTPTMNCLAFMQDTHGWTVSPSCRTPTDTHGWTVSPSCRTPTDELPRLHAGHPRMRNRQPVLLEVLCCSRNVHLLQQRALLLENSVRADSCHRTEYYEKSIPLTWSDAHLVHRYLTRLAKQHMKETAARPPLGRGSLRQSAQSCLCRWWWLQSDPKRHCDSGTPEHNT